MSVNPRDRARGRRAAAAAFLLACASLLVLTPPAAAAPATLPPPDACVDGERSPLPPDDEGKDPGLCSSARLLRQPLVSGGEAALLEADSDTDVTHYFLDLEIIPEYAGSTVTAVRVEGVSTIDLEPTTDGLTSFTVDLHSSLTVNAVDGDVRELVAGRTHRSRSSSIGPTTPVSRCRSRWTTRAIRRRPASGRFAGGCEAAIW